MNAQADISSFVVDDPAGHAKRLYLMVDGMRCASCAWNIESTLNAEPQVHARINLSTKRLAIDWEGPPARANDLVARVSALGFRLTPYDASRQQRGEDTEARFLLKCIAVAGFASGNLMAFSLALWFSSQESMGVATRDMMHWVSAIIALPAIIYAGIPYYMSAWNVLKHGRTNMDVPISLAVVLAAGMSLFETFRHGEYVYFDSSVMLLFFLLIGRFLDKKARGRARMAAQDLLTMTQGNATVKEGEVLRTLPIRELLPGMRLVVAAGEKIAADGEIATGISDIDTSLITGETLPQRVEPGQKLFAGMINMTAPLDITVSAASEQSLLADIIRLMEKAEQGQAKYVRIADKVAGWYTPVVHILALASFLGWLAAGLAWQKALMVATTVLIITCPCALGLAVPVVQVLASGRLFRGGMLLKSGDALERLAVVDTVVLDKTGTLTLGKPQLTNRADISDAQLQIAASLAAYSKHPLSRAVAAAWAGELLNLAVHEEAGNGLVSVHDGRAVHLGRRGWCGNADAAGDPALELWLAVEGQDPLRLVFSDRLRSDAAGVVKRLMAQGMQVVLLSGDRELAVQSVAAELGIKDYMAAVTPVDKSARIAALSQQGRRVLMVGDGLNDAPSLAAAHVSMSPASAIDIAQNAADIVFQGEKLMPVVEAMAIARASMRLVKQNFALSFLYNVLAIPLAVMGLITPLIAAIAMSSSSLIVVVNAMRLNRVRAG